MNAITRLYAGETNLDQQDAAPRVIIKLNADGSVSVSAGLGKCAGCGKIAGFFINRDGVSLCSATCSSAVRHG